MSQNFSLRSLFGGVPLVDDTFNARRMLTAVATTRLFRAGRAKEIERSQGKELEALLSDALIPQRALELRHHSGFVSFPDDVAKMAPEDQHIAQQTLHGLAALVERWHILDSVPFNFAELRRPGVISSSNFGHPQHIFLSREAFRSPLELTEQILHESSHNWLYFIEEMWPLHTTHGEVTVDLPSGTSHRNPAEVLGASHVTTNLLTLYRSLPASDATHHRIRELEDYLCGCAELIRSVEPHLTVIGKEIGARLLEVNRSVVLGVRCAE
ncbi:HEXXH motif-containing putative peptide modification protein [Streptomyces achromogenes]